MKELSKQTLELIKKESERQFPYKSDSTARHFFRLGAEKCLKSESILSSLKGGEWVSVKDGLPEVGQVVDIWRMVQTQYLERALSLKGTDYANKYYHETEYNGWRSCNYKFSIEKDDVGDINCFTALNERFLTDKQSYSYSKLCVENGEVTHWMPLPTPPNK